MDIQITPAAETCFLEEWGFEEGDHIRVYVRYQGGGSDPFSLGLTKDVPRRAGIATENGKLTFFMDQDDLWYLDGRSLTIDLQGGDIVFRLA